MYNKYIHFHLNMFLKYFSSPKNWTITNLNSYPKYKGELNNPTFLNDKWAHCLHIPLVTLTMEINAINFRWLYMRRRFKIKTNNIFYNCTENWLIWHNPGYIKPRRFSLNCASLLPLWLCSSKRGCTRCKYWEICNLLKMI